MIRHVPVVLCVALLRPSVVTALRGRPAGSLSHPRRRSSDSHSLGTRCGSGRRRRRHDILVLDLGAEDRQPRTVAVLRFRRPPHIFLGPMRSQGAGVESVAECR